MTQLHPRTRHGALRTTLTVAACCIAAVPVAAQPAPRQDARASGAPTLLLADLAFDGESANAITSDDRAAAARATVELRARLRDAHTLTLADSALGADALARAGQPGAPCGASPSCAREAARAMGATYVATGRVTKISNLIWYLSGRLVDVATGTVLLDDGFELKGPQDVVLRQGAASLARRIAARAARGSAGAATR